MTERWGARQRLNEVYKSRSAFRSSAAFHRYLGDEWDGERWITKAERFELDLVAPHANNMVDVDDPPVMSTAGWD